MLSVAIPLAVLLPIGAKGQAQTNSSVLIPISQVWKYSDQGQDLGTAWKEVDYPADNWPSGPALFGRDTQPFVEPFPEPFRTPLTVYPGGDTNQILTYYFRTHFQFSGPTNGLVLMAGMLLDDGAVYYLNGTEAGRLRVPPGQNYWTPMDSEHQFYEGYYELLTLSSPSLVQGDNVLAAEVHQSNYPGYSNVVFGLTLRAAWLLPPKIVRQPCIIGAIQGFPTTLGVEASGSFISYQWYKDNAAIPAATNSTYNFSSTQPTNAGSYSVVVSNTLGSVSSSNVTLSVLPRGSPFMLLSAARGAANSLQLGFSQGVVKTATMHFPMSNFTVSVLSDPAPLSMTNAIAIGSRVLLQGITPWDDSASLVVTVQGLQDANGHWIGPENQAISWAPPANGVQLEVVPMHAAWRYSQDPLYDPEGKWKGLDYDDSRWEGPARAFIAGTNYQTTGPIDTRLSYIGPTVYFRTTFTLPGSLMSTGALTIDCAFKYAAVLYLNGTEVTRFGINPGPVDFGTFTSWAWSGSGLTPDLAPWSRTVAVSNFLSGTNVLAAEVHQQPGYLIPLWAGPLPDMVFGARVVANLQPVSQPPLSLKIARQGDQSVLTSPASAVAFEGAPEVAGPWSPLVTDTNSLAVPISDPLRYFRLRSW